ncbi:interferon alpha/beta receptor 1b-like [Aulostomus maculatus]
MSAALHFCLLFWCLQACAGSTLTMVTKGVGEAAPRTSPATAEVPPPENLTLVTLNTNYTLRWDWDQSAAESHTVSFTIQYVAKFKLKRRVDPDWNTACEQTSHRSCDLTERKLHYLGIYMVRVQASVNKKLSNWTLKEFCPDKDAAVGPPTKVALAPAGSDLDVYISDPVTSTNSSMKEHLPKLYYRIQYWEHDENRELVTIETLMSSANIVTLPELKAWTWYCVRVQSCSAFYSKISDFTSPLCMQTEGAVPWWKIFLYFLVSLVVCFLVVFLSVLVSFRCYKTIKATFYPSILLPPPLQEYLCDSPGSDIPHLLSLDPEVELLHDKVYICPEPLFLEIHDPPPEVLPAPSPGLDPDSSGRHSRQNSKGSGDSGVYSSGSGSSLQPNSSQSSTGPDVSWQGPIDLDRLKMRDMTPGLENQCLIADEGIVDMCV